ncbi:putative phosphatidylglycerol/phosphatidylinositol transfer protein DDB_G0282179 [Selaginella moellendorffii]|uniref:putative phosphatidylglycerol/phosphatidylinositol transfer protein DDB_G0282179 n=1 Tax=Selaginella moellendorffii TaxID=88036 RepID=UPI000D1C5EC3|nr:putative phosphatidylglycerol/phosphatidylinositol transfer protein DDB_G0282179 [Selaginella moellendorffii]|eukprot:XP_024541094.1 putative phosphatidylglycerol/phosphatidylinositol transfer protein DDB_G0282179 [Selaginella moellendorffii]
MASAGNLLCVLAMAATAALAVASSWELCDKYKSYSVKIKDVEVLPDPVVSGQDAAFVVPASTSVPIKSGTVIVTVLWHNIPVHREVDDLCEKTKCPIAAGDFVLNSTQALPGFTPSGKYKIRMQIVQGSSLLACANIQFQIVWRRLDAAA